MSENYYCCLAWADYLNPDSLAASLIADFDLSVVVPSFVADSYKPAVVAAAVFAFDEPCKDSAYYTDSAFLAEHMDEDNGKVG